jgi:hypothetical protein
VIAPTGSGKTLGYLLPAAAVCLESEKQQAHPRAGASPIAVVVCPTRELAQQVHRVCRPFDRLFQLRAVCATGGADKAKQIEELSTTTGGRPPPQLLVGTPGRLHDLLGGLSREEREQQLHEEWEQLQQQQKQQLLDSVPVMEKPRPSVRVAEVALLSLAHVQLLVLDEMDKLLSMGNNYELQSIRSACACTGLGGGDDGGLSSTSVGTRGRPRVQVLLFSATIPAALKDAVAQWVKDPIRLKVRSSTAAAAAAAIAETETATKTGPAPHRQATGGDDGDKGNDGERAPAGGGHAVASMPNHDQDQRLRPTDDQEGSRRGEEEQHEKQPEEAKERQEEEEEEDEDGMALTVASSIEQVVHVCGECAV